MTEEAEVEESSKRARTSKEETNAEEEGEEESLYQVHITSNKACQAFKRTVDKLKKVVLDELPDTKIVVLEEKKLSRNPDKGSFVVVVKTKAGEDKTLVSLVAMPRPFKAMKDLSMDDLGAEVIKELR